MAVSSKHRWISCGKLTLKKVGDTQNVFAEFEIEHLEQALRDRVDNDNSMRLMQGETKSMWCSQLKSNEKHLSILLSYGDKNAADSAYVNVKTRQTRVNTKGEDEANHHTSHILLKRDADNDGSYNVCLERVDGITLSSLAAYLTWVLNDRVYFVDVEHDNGTVKPSRIRAAILGFTNMTIKQAITSGKLEDIELVGTVKSAGSLDENSIIQEKTQSLTLSIKKKIESNRIGELINIFNNEKEDWLSPLENNRAYIRIKTSDDQSKLTEIDLEKEDYLQDEFYEKKLVRGFTQPLPQYYENFLAEMEQKMIQIARDFDD